MVVGLCTFAWFTQLNGPFPIHGDGIRDQLLVRDCTELGRCHLLGAPSSMRGQFHIFQGAVWLDLLTAVRLLGGDTTTQVEVVLALDALAAALTFMVVWRWLHPALALPAGYLVAHALAGDQTASLLVAGSASALFDIVTAAGVLCYGISNRVRFLLVSAFAAALAVNVHVWAASLLPGTLLVFALGPRPYRAVVVAIMLFGAVYLATSGAALWTNCIAIGDRGLTVALLPAAIGFAVVATMCGPRFRRLSVTTRAVSIAGFLILPFVVGALWLVLIEKHSFEARYFHPIFGPLAVLEAALVCAPFLLLAGRARWLPWIPSVLALWLLTQHVSGASAPSDPLRTWTLTDATTIGLEAATQGLTFEDLVFHLQAKACGELLLGIAVEGPRLERTPPADDLQLQVATVESRPAPTKDEPVVVPLQTGRFGIVRTIHSWLRSRGILVCRRSLNAAVPPSCRPLEGMQETRSAQDDVRRMAGGGDDVPGDLSFESRAALTHEYIDVPSPYVTSYRIPVHPVAGETRELRLADAGADGCRWEFAQSTGLHVQNVLPATHVRLAGDSDSPGELVIEKMFGGPPCPPHEMEFPYPPCVLETRPGEEFEMFAAGSR